MKRQSRFTSVFAAAFCLIVLLAVPARAQEPRVLYGTIGGLSFEFGPISAALRDLDIVPTRAGNSPEFLDELRFGQWDLVIFRSKQRFLEPIEFQIIAELEDHVASGGALHFQMADMENAPPELLDLLGLDAAVDLRLPLSEIEFSPPKHPSVAGGGFLSLWDESFPPDFGDALVPASGATVTQRYIVDGRPSTVLSWSGRVIVNGQQWDNWVPISSASLIANQIRWLLRCPADLDLDGELTFTDFLVFQNQFALGDTAVDFDGDGRLTIFDFLEFFNQFEAGCP